VTGLTASAGISCNKSLAKLAPNQRKPNGQFVITPDMGSAFVADLPVARFHRVGPATAAKQASLGIQTCQDLRQRPPTFLQEHFGKAGAHFHAIARGQDDRPVRPDRPRKSAGNETTYATDLATTTEVEAAIATLADEVWAWCEKAGARGRTVTVKLRYADFRTLTRSRSAAAPVDRGMALRAIASDLVRSIYPLGQGVRLLGVTVSSFEQNLRDIAVRQEAFDFIAGTSAART
jgi:DNA polymerase-4